MYNKANLLQFEVCLRQRMVDDGVGVAMADPGDNNFLTYGPQLNYHWLTIATLTLSAACVQ